MPNLNPDIPSVDLSNYLIDPEVIKSIPERMARQHKMIPLFLVRDTLTVAMVDPLNFIALNEAKIISGCNIQPLKAEVSEIMRFIDQYYSVSNSVEEIVKDLENIDKQSLQGQINIQKIAEEPPVTKLVSLIIARALKDNASDIHIEPEKGASRVRFRIDGILHTVLSFDSITQMPIVRRIKVLSKLDITEARKPQDGHFVVRIEEREVDIRVSSFPFGLGEKVVMRILDRSTAFLSLDKLGFSSEALEKFEPLVHKPYGIILVTGPTGSGKTSTLYAALNKLNSQEKNIVTLEDPREYIIEGLNQGQVNPEIGLTFANGLRAILRQDPDIIMIGEMRDLETAEIAIRAALTGHLVLSTLHTNDAAGAITRLIDMGIEPFLISASVIGILAQRLVRVICRHCKEQYEPNDEVYTKMGLSRDNKIFLSRGKGCPLCHQTGYKGRIGIFELIVIDATLRELIAKNRPIGEIVEIANKSGMKTLCQDGYDKVMKGITTLEEVLRVTYGEE